MTPWCMVENAPCVGEQLDDGAEWMYCDPKTDMPLAHECAKITDPCKCTGNCGWNTSAGAGEFGAGGKCVLAEESTTNCNECPSMNQCKSDECMERACVTEFDPEQTCQCDEECSKYGNCCDDVAKCSSSSLKRKCSKIKDPCKCPEGCGYSTPKGFCEPGSSTSCPECPTIGGCKNHTCKEQGCVLEFNPENECQCDDVCEDYGNCCKDIKECRLVVDRDLPTCKCMDRWVDPSSDSKDCHKPQKLCPEDPCDGYEAPWCSVANAPCNGERLDYGGGWMTCNSKSGYPSDCDLIHEPCQCLGYCGWSSSRGKCVKIEKGDDTETSCDECSTMPHCTNKKCDELGCKSEFEATNVCQCTEDCADYGNCCEDRDSCDSCGFDGVRIKLRKKSVTMDFKNVEDACACETLCTGEDAWLYNKKKKACWCRSMKGEDRNRAKKHDDYASSYDIEKKN